VDSIGAGDAFDAAFLLGLLEGWTLDGAARFAAVTAGFSVGGVGGTAAMPTRAQVETYIAGKPFAPLRVTRPNRRRSVRLSQPASSSGRR